MTKIKNRNTVSPRRNSRGQFTSGQNLRKGSVYLWAEKNLPVRVVSFTRNNLALVSFQDCMFRLIYPSELQKISKSQVRDYLNSF